MPKRVPNRAYVQPQWIYDCINAQKVPRCCYPATLALFFVLTLHCVLVCVSQLLPAADYAPGVLLPPHLSPFVLAGAGDYVPEEALPEDERHAALASAAADDTEVLSDDGA